MPDNATDAAPEAPEATESQVLRAIIVDDEPLAVRRMEVLCAEIPQVSVVGTAADGEEALALAAKTAPDLVLLDMTMPGLDGLAVTRQLAKQAQQPQQAQQTRPPAVIFVTAHDHFAVAAFDLEAVDYVLKPVAADRLQRAIERAVKRRGDAVAAPTDSAPPATNWLEEFWVPQRSELLRIAVSEVDRVDAERDYVRLHVEDNSYLLLQTIAGIEKSLDPQQFIRIHRSTILRRDTIRGLKHEGLGVWSVELMSGKTLRIGRTYLRAVKAMAGR